MRTEVFIYQEGGDIVTEMDIEVIKNVIKNTRIATTSYTHSQIYEIILRAIDSMKKD